MNLLFPILGAATVTKLVSDYTEVKAAASPYLAQIKEVAARYNFNPSILTAILWQESRFNPYAVGQSGEIGMAQFKPIALRDIQQAELVPVAWAIDDLHDPVKAIESAGALLALNRKRSGSLYISIRAYNAGIGAASDDVSAGLGYMTDILMTASAFLVGSTFEGI